MLLPRIAFIDPIISSAYLAQKLRHNGFESIAILTPQLSRNHNFFSTKLAPYEYDYVIRIDESENHVTNKLDLLRELNPIHLFYGFEFSIPFADRIIKNIFPDKVNSLMLTNARYDKFDMHQALSYSKLPYAIHQIKITHADLPFLQEKLNGFNFPVYTKPAISAVSMGGYVCHSYDNLYETLNKYFNKVHAGKESDNCYLIQEFIYGAEHCIDTVSINGVHHIVGLCEYKKKYLYNKAIPFTTESVSPDQNPCWNKVERFIRETLSALGYLNGFAHTEFFLLEDGSIKLVEVNFRISGAVGYINKLFELAHGRNAIDVLKYAITNPMPTQPISTGYSKRIYIHNWLLEPRPFDIGNTSKLQKVSSYREHLIFHPNKTILEPAAQFEHIYDAIGQILLHNTNQAQLHKDAELIEDLFANKQIF